MKSLLRCISKANNHLLKETNINDALNFCISGIGAEQDIDRCYIFINKIINGNLKLYYQYEWCNTNIEPYLGNPALSGLSYDEFPGLYDSLSLDEPIFGVVRDSDNTLFKATMEMQGIQSYLFTPIFSNNDFWGWIGYDDCKNKRQWTEEEVYALHTIAKNIGLRLNQDATASKLKTNIEKFDFYMSNSNQAMWELDLATNIGSISNNWPSILGYTNDEILDAYDLFFKNFHPDDIDKISSEINNYIIGKSKNYGGVRRILHKKGHYVTVKYFGMIKKDKDQIPVKIIGTYIDISELTDKEHQLKLSEEKFRFIAENSNDLICQHDLDGNFTYLSPSSYEILGYKPQELLSKSPRNFIMKKDLKSIQKYYEKIIQNELIGEISIRFKNKKDCYIWLELSTKVIIIASNEVVGFQTSSRDISERVKNERLMKVAFIKEKKLNELKSQFVSMASHQFRTPLAVIYSNSELLDIKLKHLSTAIIDDFGAITKRIKSEVDRMTLLMNNILIFGQYESRNIEKEIQPLNFLQFLSTLILTYFDNERCGRKINMEITGSAKIFYSDETLLTHILTNLISNAFKYSAGKANPQLKINYLEKEIEIQVTDYGIGIPKKEMQNLFTSFFRASNTTTIIGSGLGLVIVKQFTEFLEGTIELHSQENLGTQIKLIFPYAQK